MKKLIITLILITAAPLSFGQDATLEISPFAASENNFHGVMLGTTLGDNWLVQANIIAAPNLGGFGFGVGKKFGNLSIIAGAVFDAELDKESGFINMGSAFDNSATPDVDSPVFIEAEYKGFFVRHTEYEGNYILRGQRTVPGPVTPITVNVSETIDIDDSVTYFGYRIRF